MNAAPSVLPASFTAAANVAPAPGRHARARRSPRKRPLIQRAAKVTPTLFAVSCMCCELLGPISSNPERGRSPAKRSGWLFQAIGDVSGWICRTCHRAYRALHPPPTRGDCSDGPRPCPHTLCRYHLCGDVSRKASDDFRLTETCALDIADRGEHTLREVGEILGMTREGSRWQILLAFRKLNAIPGLGFDFLDEVDEDDREGRR